MVTNTRDAAQKEKGNGTARGQFDGQKPTVHCRRGRCSGVEMGKTGTGLNAAWHTGVKCKCGYNLLAFPVVIEEKYVAYNFMCKPCNKTGSWSLLARGYVENARRRR